MLWVFSLVTSESCVSIRESNRKGRVGNLFRGETASRLGGLLSIVSDRGT